VHRAASAWLADTHARPEMPQYATLNPGISALTASHALALPHAGTGSGWKWQTFALRVLVSNFFEKAVCHFQPAISTKPFVMWHHSGAPGKCGITNNHKR